MSRSTRSVISAKRVKTDRLPEWANEGSVLVEWLHRRGLLDGIADRLKIQREGGYVGLDLVLFLLFFLSARLAGGIKGFGERAAPHRQQLGALGGRRRLPAPASISRILAAAEPHHADVLSEWLLFDACEAKPLLCHPAVATRDALGEAWQVFDLDPTTTVLRQRALPEGDDDELPPARRRAIEAQPGYTGRKRGDVQLSRMTLQHAGSSLWMGLWVAPGNGDWRKHSEAAVQRVRSICDRIDHAADHALVRVDGAGGNVPLFTVCHEAGVHYVTRWSQYEILDQPEIRRHLNAAAWASVVDSGSGPRRQATDLGWVTLQPADATIRDDGSAYAAVRVRMVVSRFQSQTPDKKRGAGRLIEGWQYELYVTEVASDAWPAHEVVTTYYGRCGEENRFYQEDQEIGLDHIFSYDVAGQQLANLVGLFLWNLRVCRGFEQLTVPADVPAQPLRVAADVEGGTTLPVEDPSAADVTLAAEPEPAAREVSPTPNGADPIEPARDVSPASPGQPKPPPVDVSKPVATCAEAREGLRQAMNALVWPDLLDDKPGWRWDTADGLMCPNGSIQRLQAIRIQGWDRTRQLRFLAPYLACSGCKFRSGCTSSNEPLFRKDTAITVPTATAYPIHQFHQLVHRRPPPPPPSSIVATPRRHCRTSKVSPNTPRSSTLAPAPPDTMPPAGPFAVTAAVLLPAKLRQHLVRACRGFEVHVRVVLPDHERPEAVFALTSGERQNRRLTWSQRHRWNNLPAGGDVKITFAGADRMDPLLRRSFAHAPASKVA